VLGRKDQMERFTFLLSWVMDPSRDPPSVTEKVWCIEKVHGIENVLGIYQHDDFFILSSI